MFHHPRITRSRHRRGAISVLAAFCLVFVLAMVAFAVDIGYIAHVDTELQRTADACAIAAVHELPNQIAARTVAKNVAQQNMGTDGPVLSDSDVQFGYWDRDTATFAATTSYPNAVRVTVRRSSASGQPLTLFFAPAFGVDEVDVDASAIAMYDTELCGPLVGIDSIRITGTPETDSFRSSEGSYSSQTPGEAGHICSDGEIEVIGTAEVHGNANPGKGHTVEIVGSAEVTGNTTPRLRPLNMPPVDTDEIEDEHDNGSLPPIVRITGKKSVGSSPLDSNRNFTLTGTTSYDIPEGDYYFNDLTLSGQSSLNVSGKTRIWLTGNLRTAGGKLANNTGKADQLQILMTGGTADITGNVDFYAVIYAPDTAVEIQGTGQLTGAVVGKTLRMTGTGDIHYDEDLDLSDTIDLPKRVALVQ